MIQSLKIYGHFLDSITSKEIDIKNDDIKVMLVSSSYVPNQYGDKFKSDVSGEINGVGYDIGGKSLTNTTYTNSNGISILKANNIKWTNLNIRNLKYAVIYDNTPFKSLSNLDEAKTLIGYIEYEEPLTIVNAELEIVWNKEGILKFILG